MNRNKCAGCGLVNLATDQTCRRCGTPLAGPEITGPAPEDVGPIHDEPERKRGLGSRLLWIAGTSLAILFIWYVSLLLTSEPLGFDERQDIHRAIVLLEERGFGKEAFVLGHLANYRATDNWWNMYIGHHDAYAATNFPFEVVTLYPDFFKVSTDDNERAAMLLHEAYHLLGSGEAAALEGVWREKQRVGWTADKYGDTKVWRNTKELTMSYVPALFQCGPDGHSDCIR